MLCLGRGDEKLENNLEEHLASCPECTAEHKRAEQFRTVIGDYTRPEPDPAAWKRWDERLERNLDAIDRERVDKRRGRFHHLWSIRLGILSSAAAIFLLGIATGRLVLPPADTVEHVAESTPVMQFALTGTNSRAYIDRSKLLILGVTQTDPARYGGAANSNLDRMKRIARELLDEAPGLKERLADRQEYRMYALVSELEIILLQIAAFDEENTREQLELVQAGVEHKSLLFRINLENLVAETQTADPYLADTCNGL